MTFDEEIAALKATTVADVRQFYKDFYGADNRHRGRGGRHRRGGG